jgi:hypothetical protein
MKFPISGRKLKGVLDLKKTPLGAVWDAPAGLKEAIQPPAQHRSLQLPGLRGGKTEQTARMHETVCLAENEAKLAIETYMNLTHTCTTFLAPEVLGSGVVTSV